MKYADVAYAGVPIAPAGLPSTFGLKGYRVVPVLAAGATAADVLNAYASLVVRTSRASQSRSLSGDPTAGGITDDVAVVGPDWIRSPGFNALLIQSGQAGVTYRVWWAEDCFEIVDAASPPYLNGFTGPSATAASPAMGIIGPAGAVSQAQASAANIPSLATDGVAIPRGARGALALLAAPAAQTVTLGTLVWWRYSALTGRWAETAVQEATATARRDVMGAEQLVTVDYPSDRLYVEARQCTCSGAGNVEVTLVIT